MQPAVADKTKELTALPELLSLLESESALVSLEARGCPKTIARDILAAGAA